MPSLTMRFSADQLVETCFVSEFPPQKVQAVRGKTAGAYREFGTFQWTSAVHALCIMMIRAKLMSVRKSQIAAGLIAETISGPALQGGAASAAGSLDFALSKEPAWIVDMFGIDVRGEALAKRMIARTNSNRKRPGPVALSLNERMLPAAAVKIFIDDALVEDARDLEVFASCLQSQWEAQRRKEVPAATSVSEISAKAA